MLARNSKVIDYLELNFFGYRVNNYYPVTVPNLKFLAGVLLGTLNEVRLNNYTIELVVTNFKNNIKNVLTFLKYNEWSRYKLLTDIIGVDYPGKKDRFEVNYQLLSIERVSRILVSTHTSELKPIPSVWEIFSSALWSEREVWDLFGVFFFGHPDLRRILTDYGFEGHPFRKDFPLTGYIELFYDDSKKRIVYEPVSLAQEYRHYEFVNPWLEI